MSDLVERLRIIASGLVHDGDDWEVVREAADEIEKLREVVARYEAARCIRCGCQFGAYHPADAQRILYRRDKIDRLFRENVRRREAIEKHRRAMEEERIQSYYFDRELWAVLGDDINTMNQSLWDTAINNMVKGYLPRAILNPNPCTFGDLSTESDTKGSDP